MTTLEHYENHLASFYSWMVGDFEMAREAFEAFLDRHELKPVQSGVALDLGAGHGIQSVAMANAGFQVTAVDFSKKLLTELKEQDKEDKVQVLESDIRSFENFKAITPELITCCGDTIAHLESKEQVELFIENCLALLVEGGKLVLSFRDYSHELKGEDRIIPVKSDAHNIHTCFLEYGEETLRVTDILHRQVDGKWNQEASSYEKVRVSVDMILSILSKQQKGAWVEQTSKGLYSVIVKK